MDKILKKSGWYILTTLILLPLIFWLFMEPLNVRFMGANGFVKSLGDITGLVGMAAFSLVIILSARLKLFEKFFNGINEVYTAHHFLGGIAFSLLLFHPLLLAYNYLLFSVESAALFLLPSANNWAKNFGIAGLLIMIITLAITFYTKLKYQTWKYTHKFLGLAFVFAVFHTFMGYGDVYSNIFLRIYFFILSALGIAAFLYRALFANFLVKTFEYKIKNIESKPDKIWELELEPKDKEINLKPGQFGFIKIINQHMSKEAHPFSFSSTTGNPLKIAIKELGDYTKKINELRVGDLVFIEGPYGAFNFRNYGVEQVWIGGGVGITPFLSMARSLSEKDYGYKIKLYYLARDQGYLTFKDDFEKINLANKNLEVFFWPTSEKGLLTAKEIKVTKNSDILICGPSPMMNSLKEQFNKIGVSKRKIHTEEFSLY
jgi:predicted ferric reductase